GSTTVAWPGAAHFLPAAGWKWESRATAVSVSSSVELRDDASASSSARRGVCSRKRPDMLIPTAKGGELDICCDEQVCMTRRWRKQDSNLSVPNSSGWR